MFQYQMGIKAQDEPVKSIPTGETKYNSCYRAMAEFKKIAMTSRMSEEALKKLQNEMLKGCIGAMPMPPKPYPKPYPTKPSLPPIKPSRVKGG